MTYPDRLMKTAPKFIHNHIKKGKCEAILEQLIIPKHTASKVYVKKPQNGIYHGSIDKIIELYNKLPATVRAMSVGQFKKYIKRNPVKTS